jgi:hypothetical protein
VARPPIRCVVDTNVAATANGAHDAASATCVVACARALQAIMSSGHLFIDAAGRILAEYRNNLSTKGQPGPGDAFLKWVLTYEWVAQRVTRVTITPRNEEHDEYEELPPPRAGVTYDPADRKFLAVAAAHGEHPAILQALDSKWWGWQDSLADCGVTIHFLCPEIEQKHQEKMGR